MSDTTQPIPVTTDTLHRWTPVLVALLASAFTVGGAVAYFRFSISDVERRVTVLEVSRTSDQRELLARMKSIEKLLAQLVCEAKGVSSPPCEKAMAAIGQ